MNQINVHDKAHELARAVKASDQYTTLVQMKAQVDEAQRQENGKKLYSLWMHQADETKMVYPSFDIHAYVQNI